MRVASGLPSTRGQRDKGVGRSNASHSSNPSTIDRSWIFPGPIAGMPAMARCALPAWYNVYRSRNNSEPIASGSQAPSLVGAIASGSKAPIERAVIMKLIKKQLSASYVTQATVSVVRHIDDVANCENYRLDCCLTASPEGKVELPAHVSFRKTSRERVWSPCRGLEKHSQLRERHPSCNVEEGPQSVMYRDTCYVNDKAREQWRRSDSGYLR